MATGTAAKRDLPVFFHRRLDRGWKKRGDRKYPLNALLIVGARAEQISIRRSRRSATVSPAECSRTNSGLQPQPHVRLHTRLNERDAKEPRRINGRVKPPRILRRHDALRWKSSYSISRELTSSRVLARVRTLGCPESSCRF